LDKHLTFEIFKNEVEKFDVSTDNSYVKTYAEFLKYFEDIKTINEHHLTISSHFVYGWMPTIINFKIQEREKTLELLNKAKAGIDLSIPELNYLKVCINNSLVGLSKLLHFINPNKYAIWDSRIFRFVTGKKSQYGIGEPKHYLNYLSIISNISQNKDYAKLHHQIEKCFDYSLSSTRAIEVVIFEADKKRQKALKLNE
jgi:hypothetical protein